MPDPSPAADAGAARPFEDVLVDLLQAMERHGDSAIEAACAEHPGHAARLRAHARRLADLGFLAAAQGGAETAGLPERLGDYRPLHRIGSGGMGMVYAAEQASLGRRVALKLVRPEQLCFAGARERFAREVNAIARLQHPGIVPVYDAGETAGLPWLAMELVDGAPLDQVLEAVQDRPPAALTGADLEQTVLRIAASRRSAGGAGGSATSATRPPLFLGGWSAASLRLARAVADALVHAHERGVLHRDVKPSNVVVTPDGRALLLDFGLALSDGSARLTQGQLGSPAYMSPEQVRGEELDARTDVWSLGVTLCELLTLHSPYAAESAERTRENVRAAHPPALRVRNPAVSRETELVCRTAMAPERAARYATMRAFAADLDNLLERRPVQARPATLPLVLRRWAQRRPATAVAAAAAVLLLVVAPTAFWLQQRAANASIRAALGVAEEQRDAAHRATAEARRHRDHARAAVQTLLTRVGSEELRDVPHMQELRRDLLAAARAFHARFLAEATGDPELLAQAAESAVELARVDLELGLLEQARTEAERAVALARSRLATEGESPAARHALADAIAMLAGTMVQLGDRADARAAIAEAIALQQRLVEEAPADPAAIAKLVEYLRVAGTTDALLERYADAAAVQREIRALWQAAEANDATSPSLREMVLAAAADAACLHHQSGDYASAREAAEAALALGAAPDPTTLSSIERVAVARVHDVTAKLLRQAGDAAGAEAAARRSLAAIDALLAELPQHANALTVRAGTLNTLAFTLQRLPDRRDEAQTLYGEAIATLRRLVAVDGGTVSGRGNLATSLSNLGAMRLEARDFSGAAATFHQAIQLLDEIRADAPDDPRWPVIAANAWNYLARIAGEQRDHAAMADAAERMAAMRPDDAQTQRIAGMLLANVCFHLRADQALPAADRDRCLDERRRRCLDLLQRAADLGCPDHEFLATSAWFAEVRGMAGFGPIVDRMRANAEARAGR
ncbi:MAG: serine/threonine protein kinase [Planctomycetes bacterium]|nr:serine/threonine protein kinase [Planctomycetota bacterium]